MEETVVFEQNNVKVTNARFIVDGQTYVMNGVTSVKQFEKKPARVIPIIVGLVGLGTLAQTFLGGLIILIVAAGIWFIQKAQYSVLLQTSSGSSQALTSTDGVYIARVVAALNDAIISRG